MWKENAEGRDSGRLSSMGVSMWSKSSITTEKGEIKMRRIRLSLGRERMMVRKSLQIDRIKRDKIMNNSFYGRLGGSKRTSIPTQNKEMYEIPNEKRVENPAPWSPTFYGSDRRRRLENHLAKVSDDCSSFSQSESTD